MTRPQKIHIKFKFPDDKEFIVRHEQAPCLAVLNISEDHSEFLNTYAGRLAMTTLTTKELRIYERVRFTPISVTHFPILRLSGLTQQELVSYVTLMRTLIPEYEPLLEDVVNGEPPSLTFKAEEACGEYINIAFRLMRACHEHPAFVRRVLKYVEMDGVDAAMALILAMWFMQKEDGNYVTCYPYEFPLFNASIPHPVISTYILDFLSYQHFTGIGGRKLIQDNWSRRPMFNQVDTVMLGTTYQNIYTHLRKQLTAGDVLAPGFITEFVEAMIKGGGDIVDLVARYHRAA